MRAWAPTVSVSLALACTSPAAPSDAAGEASSDTAADVETSASFVPDGSDTETGLTPVDSHDEDIQPYWTQHCVIYCHGGDPNNAAGILDLQLGKAYDAIVDVQATQADMLLVAPGSPENSYLWHKLNGTHLDVGGMGEPMPLISPPLDAETMARIETWITIGAPP